MPDPIPQKITQHHPSARELDDLELLLNGGYAPRTGYDVDGPVSLVRPEGLDGTIELVDAEGLPLARVGADGTVTGLAAPVTGAFRRLHLAPADVRTAYAGALPVAVAAPLTDDDLARISEARAGRPVLLLALTGHGTPQ
ncbi:MAG: cysC, partial [Nocardioidaceae bacterium]|nr:cysC [Nocardioidaceae bacterium]